MRAHAAYQDESWILRRRTVTTPNIEPSRSASPAFFAEADDADEMLKIDEDDDDLEDDFEDDDEFDDEFDDEDENWEDEFDEELDDEETDDE
jgi:hypothetical protein